MLMSLLGQQTISADHLQSSSTGPTDSARGEFCRSTAYRFNQPMDGLSDSYNNDLRLEPAVNPMASFGILQQLLKMAGLQVQRSTSPTNLSDIKPQWSTLPSTNLLLSEGFTPSGALLSLMVLSTSPIANENEYFLHEKCWLGHTSDLSQLIDLNELKGNLGQQAIAPASDIWVHDSCIDRISEIFTTGLANMMNSLLQTMEWR